MQVLGGVREFPQTASKQGSCNRRHVVNKQFPLEMIILMLDRPSGQAAGFQYKLFSIKARRSDLHTVGTDDFLVNPREGQTAFFHFELAIGCEDYRIDEHSEGFSQVDR